MPARTNKQIEGRISLSTWRHEGVRRLSSSRSLYQ